MARRYPPATLAFVMAVAEQNLVRLNLVEVKKFRNGFNVRVLPRPKRKKGEIE